jgi:putative peptidoglycan lipid II flippase
MKVWKLLIPILLGVSFTNVDQIVNGYFASGLNIGSQAVIQYANRLELIPIGVFAQAMGIAILPAMSKLAAADLMDELRATINRGLRTILFVTIPASALLFVLAVPIITVLSQHGHFGATATARSAAALQSFCVGIFAWSSHAVLTRAFYALHDSRTPVITGTLMTVVFIGMEWAVVRYTTWGVDGLALATSIAAILYMAILYIVLRRRLHGLLDRKLATSTAKTLIAAAAMTAALYATRTAASHHLGHGTLPALATLALASIASLIAFIAAARLLKAPELDSVVELASRLRRRRAAP